MLYAYIAGVVILLSTLSGLYYKVCYAPKKVITKKYEKSAKELRGIYLKNSALEIELVICLDDKIIFGFENEMKGAGDAINDDNTSTDSDKLIF